MGIKMRFNIDKVPKKIEICPIKEAILELKFEPSDLPYDVVPGLLFNSLKKGGYTKVEALPNSQLPHFIRETDPNMKFAPYHCLRGEKFLIQVGPRALSIVAQNEYPGWTAFSREIELAISTAQAISFTERPISVGLRYISFFENDNVLEKKLISSVSIANNSLLTEKTVLRSEFLYEEFTCILQLTNQAVLKEKAGSLIDVDVIKVLQTDDRIIEVINVAHETEKKIFFSLLTQDFLASLKPHY